MSTLDALALKNPPPSDDALVARFNEQADRSAFDELVRRHRNRVYSLALRMVKHEEEALEIVQETFLAVFRKLPEFRGESQFGSWIHRIAANFALMHLRKKKVASQFEDDIEDASAHFDAEGRWEVFPTGMRADQLALDGELRSKLVDAVEKLPEAYRAVFMLRDWDGLSYDEIADTLETTVPAIKSRLHRARLALREDLAQYFQGREA